MFFICLSFTNFAPIMSGLYIHIPFCGSKCSYCDFYSIVGAPLHSAYFDALAKEIALRRQEINFDFLRTIYIGGGTPSVIDNEIFGGFLNLLQDFTSKSLIEEFTVEMNPDDVTASKIKMFKDAGCNRISVGIQSMVDNELKAVSRRHSANRAIEAVNTIKECGIDNLSVDLMFGLPNQTIDTLRYSLDKIISLSPTHISCYGLMYEPGTLIYRMRSDGRVKEIDDDSYIKMYSLVIDTLRGAGYQHYEISNYAKPGYVSKHNSAYWDGVPYVGLGPSAHSFDGGNIRRSNPANVREYITALSEGRLIYNEEVESPNDTHNDYILTRLRTAKGIMKTDYIGKFGSQAWDTLVKNSADMVKSGVVVLDDNGISITERGFLISDEIISDFFVD